MRIAVATDDGISISRHFGRSAAFAIFEYAKQTLKLLEQRVNNFGHHKRGECDHNHEAGNHSHESFIEALKDCQAVICRGMGRRAQTDLREKGIKIVLTNENTSAESAAEKYALGKLRTIEISDSCSHQ